MSWIGRLWHRLWGGANEAEIRRSMVERARAEQDYDRLMAKLDLVEMEVLSRRRQREERGPCG